MQIQNIVQQKVREITKKTIKNVNSSSTFTVGDDHTASEEISGVGANAKVQVSTAWMLQEVDAYAQDQKKMKEVGEKFLQFLRQIRLGLLFNRFSVKNIRDLQRELKNSKLELQFPNLQNVIDEIKLRAEVELAKFEMDEEDEWQY